MGSDFDSDVGAGVGVEVGVDVFVVGRDVVDVIAGARVDDIGPDVVCRDVGVEVGTNVPAPAASDGRRREEGDELGANDDDGADDGDSRGVAVE